MSFKVGCSPVALDPGCELIAALAAIALGR